MMTAEVSGSSNGGDDTITIKGVELNPRVVAHALYNEDQHLAEKWKERGIMGAGITGVSGVILYSEGGGFPSQQGVVEVEHGGVEPEADISVPTILGTALLGVAAVAGVVSAWRSKRYKARASSELEKVSPKVASAILEANYALPREKHGEWDGQEFVGRSSEALSEEEARVLHAIEGEIVGPGSISPIPQQLSSDPDVFVAKLSRFADSGLE
jgi:hypothetical protein